MAFSDDINTATGAMNSVSRVNVRTATTTFQTTIDAELVTYGLKTGEKNWLKERLITLCRELSARMKTRAGTVSGALLTEAGVPLLTETHVSILLES